MCYYGVEGWRRSDFFLQEQALGSDELCGRSRGRRLLLEGEKPLRLGSRAFDILIVLVEGAGDLITKEELVARVWPDTTVEESPRRHLNRLEVGGRNYDICAFIRHLWLQYVMRIISPTPHFVAFSQAVLYRGAGFAIVWPLLAAMAAIGSVYFAFALNRFRRVIFGT
jgi:hypothetical protein